ncbi:MAG: peptidase S8 [Anaerolineales bacterium]|nr:peptidase S8 [Anaerolineales bacterium]
MSAGSFQAVAFQEIETATETATEDNSVEVPPQEQATPTPTPTKPAPGTDQEDRSLPEPEAAKSQDFPPSEVVTGAHVSDEVIVRFKPATRTARIQECLEDTQTSIASEIEAIGALVLKVPDGEVGRALPRVRACAGVLYVEPNFILQAADTIPNDTGWNNQYGLVNIRAPQGWDFATGSTAVTIAIVDTGVDYGHLDLAGKLLAGYDFVNGDPNPQDDNGHGTHVAGIAAAASNNGSGVAGVSWGARILPVKVLDAFGNGTYADTASGIIWAADNGAQVINLSLGGDSPSSVLADAVNYADGQGAILVAAAGNTGINSVLYPARYPNVLAVAATDNADNRAGFSNYGPEVDLAAPGVDIYSTWPGGYGYDSGTSMSAPFVTGLVAILYGLPGNASPDGIAWQMESTALDIESAGWDQYSGYGLIQMDAAIRAALPQPIPPQLEPKFPFMPGSRQGFPFPTFTLPSASTKTSTPETGQPVSVTPTPSYTPTGRPEVIALDTAGKEMQAAESTTSPNLLMPCLGILLIILGIILFLASGPMRRKSRHRSIKM